MKKAKIYSIEEAENLKINEVHDLYSNFINPNQTKIFSALPFGNELFNKAEGPFIYTYSGKNFRLYGRSRCFGSWT